MQERKHNPSSRYISRSSALREGGFRGQFAIPGLVPDYVRENGKVKIFATADEAELAASRVVNKLANDRLALKTKFAKAQVMTASELSRALDDIDITPTELMEILQTEHVMGWLGGERRVPHMAHLIVELMRDEATENKVREITERAIEKGQRT